MRNSTKKYLGLVSGAVCACAVATGIALFGGGVQVARAETLTGFRLEEGASIRNVSPTGIRFAVTVDEATREAVSGLENVTYGTLMLPAQMLGDAELTLDTEKVLSIPTDIWAEEGARYYSVLVGRATEEGFGDFPEEFYNIPISARGYVTGTKDGQTVTYYTENMTERSIAYTASMALICGEEPTALLQKIADATAWEITMPESVSYPLGSEGIVTQGMASVIFGGTEAPIDYVRPTYSVENTSVAEVDAETGELLLKGGGSTTLTASYMFNGEVKTASCPLTVEDYEISLSFDKEVYNLEVGTASAGTLSYTVTATKNGEAWDGWTEYVTLSSSDETKLAITEEGLQVLGTGSVTVTLKYSYAGLEKSATATAELWTEIIETAEEFLSLGEWKNGTMPDWSGRYLIGQDLDFAGKTVTVLGNVTGTIDGGGHTLKHVELAATGIGLSDSSKTAAGDDRFLFYNVDGTIRNLKLSVTLGGERVGERSAGLCYQLNGRLEQSELNVRFRSLSNGQSHKMTGGVCVYAGWQSETVGCKVNVFWVFTDWGSNGQYVVVNDRGYAYCYTFWGTKSAKVTDTEFGSTGYLLYASNNDNFINGNCTIAQSSDAYLTSEEAEALFA